MNTKLLMTASAGLMFLGGALLQFLPHEILSHFRIAPNPVNALFLQLAGALYLGFAMMNWMAKAVLIGGIYARPLAMGNFVHFLVGALALLKFSLSGSASPLVWILTAAYALFAALFGYVFLTHPLKTQKDG